MKDLVLLFQCHDQTGIVAKISDFIFQKGGNIVTADQYSTDPEGGHFFIRIEFYVDEAQQTKESLANEFSPIATSFNAEWRLVEKGMRQRMGIMVSKPDHCLVDLLYLWKSGELAVDIPFVVSNHKDHKETVEAYGVPFLFIPAGPEDKKEAEILNVICEKSDFLVLARYMQIFSKSFLDSYGKDIINIHHSFLPSFKGASPYEQAYEKGVKVIGATAHFVTADLDEGPIISQIVEPVSHRDNVHDLMRKGKNLEKRALVQAVHSYIDYRVIKYKNKTIVF